MYTFFFTPTNKYKNVGVIYSELSDSTGLISIAWGSKGLGRISSIFYTTSRISKSMCPYKYAINLAPDFLLLFESRQYLEFLLLSNVFSVFHNEKEILLQKLKYTDHCLNHCIELVLDCPSYIVCLAKSSRVEIAN